MLAALDAAVEALLDDRVAAIGYGIPANLERGTGRILCGDEPSARRRRPRLGARASASGLPVGIENDASAATLAEWRRGAGRGTRESPDAHARDRRRRRDRHRRSALPRWAELGHLVVDRRAARSARVAAAATSRCSPPEAPATRPPASSRARGRRARCSSSERRRRRRGARGARANRTASLGAAIGSLVNVFDPSSWSSGEASAPLPAIWSSSRLGRRRARRRSSRRTRRCGSSRRARPEAGLVGAGLVAFEALDGSALMPLAICATPIGNLDDVTLRVLEELRRPTSSSARTRAARASSSSATGSRRGSRATTATTRRPGRRACSSAAQRRADRARLRRRASRRERPGRAADRRGGRGGPRGDGAPGASAVETALVASGLAADRYQFVGYLPRRAGELRALAESLAEWPGAVVAFESPRQAPRVAAALAEVSPAGGLRPSAAS